MSEQKRVSHPLYNLLPTEIDGFDSLAELALDMRWSWNHATDEVWRQLDPRLWEFTHNPWVVLQTVSRERIEQVLADPVFRKNIDDLVRIRRQEMVAPAWFQQHHAKSPPTCIAYFSMEFMLSEALPIYSGGLGNVAGDQLKAASDLGVPVVGVGLLYQQGYFRQVIDKDGDGLEHGDDPAWDAIEANALYDLLEQEVIPEFYTRDENGIPTAWVARMRESMALLTPQFSANRAVREYTEHYYLPAAAAYHLRIADKGAICRQMVAWRHDLEQKWATLRFGEVKIETHDKQHNYEVQVFLNGLAPKVVRIEIYADGIDNGVAVRQEMMCDRIPSDASGCTIYSAAVSADRPPEHYTARLIPYYDGVAIPLENIQILWQL